MITVKIGPDERKWESFDSIDEGWIAQQITRLQRAGEAVCVRVGVEFPNINVGLVAGQCSSGQGGGRRPNSDESRVIELWNHHVKQNGHLSPGNIIAFLHRLRQVA